MVLNFKQSVYLILYILRIYVWVIIIRLADLDVVVYSQSSCSCQILHSHEKNKIGAVCIRFFILYR